MEQNFGPEPPALCRLGLRLGRCLVELRVSLTMHALKSTRKGAQSCHKQRVLILPGYLVCTLWISTYIAVQGRVCIGSLSSKSEGITTRQCPSIGRREHPSALGKRKTMAFDNDEEASPSSCDTAYRAASLTWATHGGRSP